MRRSCHALYAQPYFAQYLAAQLGSGNRSWLDTVATLYCIKMLKMVCLQLRLSKVSELIHNSSQHRNLQQAQVSVFFEEIIDKVRANLQPNCHEAHAV
jgi:hypothetical protein